MGKINVGRLILSGIVAGIVGDILGFLVDGLWLAPRWNVEMQFLGHAEFSTHQILLFNLLGIVTGLAAIWIYAAIRPRFGPGVKTAVCAGLAVWVVGVLVPNASFMYAAGLFTRHLTLYTTLGGLAEALLGTIAGAALYKEDD